VVKGGWRDQVHACDFFDLLTDPALLDLVDEYAPLDGAFTLTTSCGMMAAF
jgi:hypothetical protein